MAKPLPEPAAAQEAIAPRPNAISAYNVCLNFQKHALESNVARDVIRARLMGYLLLYAPPLPNALPEVVRCIHSCGGDYSELSGLGQTFIDYFVRPFKKYGGRTPKASSHPSQPSFDVTMAELLATIKEAPKNHIEAKRQALIRDSYRCVVTGKYHPEAPGVTEEESIAAGVVYTECAHIIPESTYFNVSVTEDGTSQKREYAASVLAVLERFGYDFDKLNGEKAHFLYNVMTMEKNVHEWFDRLMIWFEATTAPSRYKVKATNPGFQVPPSMTFTTPDPINLHLPSSELLALHAACAQAAHLSGAGEYVDQVLKDMEEIGVLARDGTSSDVLYHAIQAGSARAISIGA